MGFQQGLSGLNAAAKNLDVIGNNVANAGTVGFKASQAQFADVYAASLAGAGASQVGLGATVASISQQFTQGNITATNNPLDIAVNGAGFFRLDNNGTITFTRNGQFQLDKDRYIVTSSGAKVTGYGVDPTTGLILTTNPIPLSVPVADLEPQATGASTNQTGVLAGINLDSRATPPTNPTFSVTDPTSYTSSTSLTIYDSLGNPHVMTLYFVATSTAGQWDLHTNVDGTDEGNVTLTGGPLTFDPSGKLTAAMPLTVDVDLDAVATDLGKTNNADPSLSFNLNFTGSTQFGSPFSVSTLTQDGFSSGRLTGFNISSDGIILGQYSNGQSKNLGQIVLANFPNPQGLKPLGNNQWAETPASNQPLINIPGAGSLGLLQSAAVEESNVDLTAELVNMITAQRVYQANAQTIKTQDAVLQTLVNLR